MNGVHDLGGVDGFGPVEVEANEPVFHHAWERVVFGLAAALRLQRLTNTHAFRHAIERMDPVHYLSSPYYEHWLTAFAAMLVEKGVVTHAELEARAGGHVPLSHPLRATAAVCSAPSAAAPRFKVGSTVVVRNLHPLGHTRCPRYVRGKRGVITRIDGLFQLPDVAAHSTERCEQYAYDVRFDGGELWGDAAEAKSAVYVDLWESYLEPA
jgi:nitrile hydratase beta subunit